MLGKTAYRVKRAYGTFRKGQIIYPTGMLKSELLANGLIELVVAAKPAAPMPKPEPAPVLETAEIPRVENATRFNREKRRGRY